MGVTEGRQVRSPAVAGMFYPAAAGELRAQVRHLLAAAESARSMELPGPPKALIVPHAGYIYSGSVAASAYAALLRGRGMIRRVVLIGPAHRTPLRGIAVSTADAFAWPGGMVEVDKAAVAQALRLPGGLVVALEEAHQNEHALEVQLPFLAEALGSFSLVPLVYGRATGAEVAQVLEALWGGPETVIVVSSDLSHYLDQAAAKALDQRTAEAIVQLKPEALGEAQACGRVAIDGLLRVARARGLGCRLLDLRTSGDTAGPRDAVVGYGAFVLG